MGIENLREALAEHELEDLFTENEVTLLAHAFNGTLYNDKVEPKTFLCVQVADTITYDNADALFNVDGDALKKKLENLSSQQCKNIIQTVFHFWETQIKEAPI